MAYDYGRPSLDRGVYAVVAYQHGVGCDYTIGCGLRVVRLRAESESDALKEADSLFQGEGPELSVDKNDDGHIEAAYVVKCVCPIDLSEFIRKADEQMAREERETIEAQIARLRSKLEEKPEVCSSRNPRE